MHAHGADGIDSESGGCKGDKPPSIAAPEKDVIGLTLFQMGREMQQHQDARLHGSTLSNALAGQDCIHQILTGIDNLFGVCEAYGDIFACSHQKRAAAACKEQVGPGGNLITQDITEDVTLGKGTSTAAHQWHKAFQACTKGHDCSHAVKLYKPVLNSVQRGLTTLVSSSLCQSNNQFKSLSLLSFTQNDYVDCTISGHPSATAGLMKIAGEVLHNLPKNALDRFPAKDIDTWYRAQLQDADSDQDVVSA